MGSEGLFGRRGAAAGGTDVGAKFVVELLCDGSESRCDLGVLLHPVEFFAEVGAEIVELAGDDLAGGADRHGEFPAVIADGAVLDDGGLRAPAEIVEMRVRAFFGGAGTSWTISGTADFNGDGKTDVLWRNDTGSVAIWLMNGAQTPAAVFVGGHAAAGGRVRQHCQIAGFTPE